ncbi:MAG: DUF1611 domain-containing protein [Candidatus Melainabacteria bacterium]|nr:DUF1611 domain-containing protein [Candidatus Melainabacteria bacterium]MBI3307990.1 DUF1611 domain-containing protein [Candidatus Melainabacteria bacterium]
MLSEKNQVIIYAQDKFGSEYAKTAIGFLRYSNQTVGVIDRKLAGKKVSDVCAGLPPVPIFTSVKEAKGVIPGADVLMIGIAPPGGQFPSEWISDMKIALSCKMNIVNGLHDFLSNNEELKKIADLNNLFIWDVRKYVKEKTIANTRLLEYNTSIILTVGTDAAIGKMTVALELTQAAKKHGCNAAFVATGQTGMMISRRGVPVDAITSDFMAGAIEAEIIEVLKERKERKDYIFVEGQGSILHPGWSGVTLALLHGSLPHKLILCHKAGRSYLKDTKIKIESLKQFIDIYEHLALPVRKAKVVGIALNTNGIAEGEAYNVIGNLESELNLPVDDVIRNSGEKLFKACQM